MGAAVMLNFGYKVFSVITDVLIFKVAHSYQIDENWLKNARAASIFEIQDSSRHVESRIQGVFLYHKCVNSKSQHPNEIW